MAFGQLYTFKGLVVFLTCAKVTETQGREGVITAAVMKGKFTCLHIIASQ